MGVHGAGVRQQTLPKAIDERKVIVEALTLFETACGLSGYLKLYRDYAPELLRRRGMVASNHPDPVATTWALSFENIEKANQAAENSYAFVPSCTLTRSPKACAMMARCGTWTGIGSAWVRTRWRSMMPLPEILNIPC